MIKYLKSLDKCKLIVLLFGVILILSEFINYFNSAILIDDLITNSIILLFLGIGAWLFCSVKNNFFNKKDEKN